MTEERWQDVKQLINSTFTVKDEYEEDLDPGMAEVIEFEGPQGLIQAKFVTKPRLLDKKTSYSNRAGSDVKVDYIFSKDDFSSHLEVYIWSEAKNSWEKIDEEVLANF